MKQPYAKNHYFVEEELDTRQEEDCQVIGQSFKAPLQTVQQTSTCAVQVLDDDYEESKTSAQLQVEQLAKEIQAWKPSKEKERVQTLLDQFGFCKPNYDGLKTKIQRAIESCDECTLAELIDEARLLGSKYPYRDDLEEAEQCLYALTGAEFK